MRSLLTFVGILLACTPLLFLLLTEPSDRPAALPYVAGGGVLLALWGVNRAARRRHARQLRQAIREAEQAGGLRGGNG